MLASQVDWNPCSQEPTDRWGEGKKPENHRWSRAPENYRITANKKPATEKDSCSAVAEVQTSRKKSMYFLKYTVPFLLQRKPGVCVLWEPSGFLRLHFQMCIPAFPKASSSPVRNRIAAPPCSAPSSLGRQIPAVLLSRIQASRWLEFTVLKQYFAIPH